MTWEVFSGWTSGKHEEYCQSIHGQRQAKGFPQRCLAIRAGLDNTQLKQKPATNNDGAANRTPSFKRTQGLTHCPRLNRFKQASENASNILSYSEALAIAKFRHFCQHFKKLGDFENIYISRILYLFKVWSC
jgi:hypothetical protein